VFGTFVNRNHFAVFIEMGLCTALGLSAAAYFTKGLKYRKALLTYAVAASCFFIVSLLFSFSRTGISLGIFTVFAFSIIVLEEFRGKRKIHKAFLLALIPAAAMVIASFRGLTYVWNRYETTFTPDNASLMSRFNFWQSTTALIRHYWCMGTGFGSFTYTSTRFESGIIPDKIAGHAHNDWLEIFSEAGIPFASFMVVFIILFYSLNMVRIIRQQDTFKKWLGIGVGLGILSVMLHEIVEFAIRTPGVMISFSVLAGLFVLCAGKPYVWIVPISKKYAAAYLLSVILIPVMLIIQIAPELSANYGREALIDRNRSFYTVKSNMSAEVDADYQIKLAERILKIHESPEVRMFLGQAQYVYANELLSGLELKDAGGETGRKIAEKELPEHPDPVVDSHADIPAEDWRNVKDILQDANANMRLALTAYPTRSVYYLRLANTLELLMKIDSRSDPSARAGATEDSIADILSAAHFYSPDIGVITRNTDMGKWRRIQRRLEREKTIPMDDADVREAMDLLKKSAEQSPFDTSAIYQVLWDAKSDEKLLADIAPDHIPAHVTLYNFFLQKGRFLAAGRQLSKILSLATNLDRPGQNEFEKLRHPPKTADQIKEFVYSQQATLYSYQGNWKAFHDIAGNRFLNLRISSNKDIEQLTKQYQDGQYITAYCSLQKILEIDPSNPEALSLAARLAWKLDKNRDLQKHLLSLLFAKEKIPGTIWRQLSGDLKQAGSSDTKKDFPVCKFLYTAVLYEEAVASSVGSQRQNSILAVKKQLNEIIESVDTKKTASWMNLHLVYFYLGNVLQLDNKYCQAMEAYAKGLEICPRALFIIDKAMATADSMREKGIELDKSVSDRLLPFSQWRDKIKPQQETGIEFDNIAELYGISVSATDINPMDTIGITYYWKCKNLIDQEYAIICNFTDQDGFKFSQSCKTGSNQFGDDMVSWRIGEIIEVTATLKPAKYYLRANNQLPPEGSYFLDICLYSGGLENRYFRSGIKAYIPVFSIVDR
ncbi:MAG: O-antigen ligase family protein, partial [Lentisphaerae bacterium]|nr:O-antigen ligase family protein [Lentisphaerota bacterium]